MARLLHKSDKKGVTPFISIILLVAMTVMIAAFVITWSEYMTKETAGRVGQQVARETVCNFNVGLNILRDSEGYQRICLNSSSEKIQAVFENRGTVRIEKIHASFVLDEGSGSEELDIAVVPGGVQVGYVQINVTSPSNIQQVYFTPAVNIQGNMYYCSDNKITVSGGSIRTC